ncbi:heavy metal translocating P-type ATPase [Slackia exigua]|uniref:Cadmium-exporting ATPase n=1 Tax=Slackia exigua (strain ATCC 700122 / DSM 15923 / CIP 105133 / JCM 11022 / KCTC 5966 / S-7) TaxID=649764 RepID=D0WJH5_SLAES|nr:heavy metal translocating P-type ATPase [Slackia exigua]EEZ60523.1 cadmium-exporting ATPase [Slackia exigua ATCC 700122]STN99673.1 Cadmium, zinc and cobalt-transporting ATPase [Slackia exigua]
MTHKQKKMLARVGAALAIFIVVEIIAHTGLVEGEHGLWIQFGLFLVPYLIAGYDVLGRAVHGITHGQPFDENLLMSIATIGAFALVFFPEAEPHMAEGAAVMLFYQVGEFFEEYAVGRTRRSITEMMDIAPDYANIMRDGDLVRVDPYEVAVGDEIVVKPGERIPLDGIVVDGASQLDTSALTGESVPRVVESGVAVVSGCVNMTGVLTVRATKPFGQSTVSRILELVEEASEKKGRTEAFITRFARYYTPIVVGLAAIIAFVSPVLFGQSWTDSIKGALIFLVVSCPCALVISVPLSFFSGIGAASRAGIMVKGSVYLEALAAAETVVFDKTGTLTNGTFNVVAVHTAEGVAPDLVLSYAAHAEAYSDHPIALSVKASYSGVIDRDQIARVEERSGMGIAADIDSHAVLVGNDKLMEAEGIDFKNCELVGTILYVALDGRHIGHIVIADVLKDDADAAVRDLHAVGVKRIVMLTGDREEVAAAVADRLGIDEFHAQLMPGDKVSRVERLMVRNDAANASGPASGKASSKRFSARFGHREGTLAFVGDGINDAPVLMRSDVGIAMGAMGSDAAIEAADIVLMDDKPSNIARTVTIARKTMAIVWQNIIFAIGVKVVIMILALPFIGIATMWLAVFGDVGVACLAILNSMRALRLGR